MCAVRQGSYDNQDNYLKNAGLHTGGSAALGAVVFNTGTAETIPLTVCGFTAAVIFVDLKIGTVFSWSDHL